jgi:molecular chaperone GrpE
MHGKPKGPPKHRDSDAPTRHGDGETSEKPREEDAIVDGGAPEASADATTEAPTPEASGDPLAGAQAEVVRLKEQWLRTAADFDNFRKRAKREQDEARRNGREDLLRAILPVFDNLERAVQSAQRSSDVKAMSDGLSMVLRQFVEALGREQITRVPTVGQAFDPSLHEAIQQVETAEHAPGTVIAEVQSGYLQGDRLVRPAMVVVAKAPESGASDAAS